MNLFHLVTVFFDTDYKDREMFDYCTPAYTKWDNQLNDFDDSGRQTFKVAKDTCKYCFRYFPRQDQLKEHIKAKHTQKPVSKNEICCEICNKTFETNQGLKTHELIHSDQNTYYCIPCEKSYGSHRALMNHIKNNGCDYPSGEMYPQHKKIVKRACIECDICHRWVARIEHHKKKHHSEESRNLVL